MHSKIRVAIVVTGLDREWIGGTNYMTNLLRAIVRTERLEPVLISGNRTLPDGFAEFRELEFHHSKYVKRWSPKFIARNLVCKLLGRDILFETYLKSLGIDVLSHSGTLGLRSRVPTVSWIPDFQHKRLPDFFSAYAVRYRDATYSQAARHATILLVSSEDAKRDFVEFYPNYESKVRVLRFVSDASRGLTKVMPRSFLETTYGLHGPYFHLPAQFWIHKNHHVVIEALQVCRDRGRPVTVVATGHTNDGRHPEYFSSLMEKVETVGCKEYFKVLGLVPYSTLVALMYHSKAVLNPSLFEGWSTTVEEAKAIGKRVILSDIAVHREQAPKQGVYFDPLDPNSLAEAMLSLGAHCIEADEKSNLEQATADNVKSFHDFGKTYETAVFAAISYGMKNETGFEAPDART